MTETLRSLRLQEQVCVRFTKDEMALMVKTIRLRHENVSNFIRRAALKEIARLGFLTDDERQALGIDNE